MGRKPHAGAAGLMLVFLCVSALTSTMASELTCDILIPALDANLQKIQSGRGKVIWKTYGDYFNAPDEGRGYEATFAFDGKKLRYDRTFDYDRSTLKEATDEAHYFKALMDRTPPDAFVEPRGKVSKSAFYGSEVNIKRLMQPYGVDIEGLSNALETGLLKDLAAVERDADGTFLIRIAHPADKQQEFRLWIDPKQGFNIVQEHLMYNGHILNDMVRTFDNTNGVWFLKSFTFTRYKPESDTIDGRATLAIVDAELNVPITADTFNLNGFGLPPNTSIYDEERDIRYKLDVAQALEDTLQEALKMADLAEAEEMLPPMQTQGDERKVPKPEDSNGGQPEPAPLAVPKTNDRQGLHWGPIIGGALAFCILASVIVLCARRRRKPTE